MAVGRPPPISKKNSAALCRDAATPVFGILDSVNPFHFAPFRVSYERLQMKQFATVTVIGRDKAVKLNLGKRLDVYWGVVKEV